MAKIYGCVTERFCWEKDGTDIGWKGGEKAKKDSVKEDLEEMRLNDV